MLLTPNGLLLHTTDEFELSCKVKDYNSVIGTILFLRRPLEVEAHGAPHHCD
jgi:hypothetical protein